ncbi:hypothetical protein T484DRAFT_1750920 [Baffinella frigidus]|nr:hypothetical protein T484DRAFT_1750920 [Cryptophyta sp. CCMP2293]
MFVKRIFVASAVLAACALVAVNERSTRSPLALLSGDDKPLGYVKLQDAGAMGTNRAFLGKADGKGTGQRGHAGMGTNSAFMGKSDGAGQSTKAMRMQQLAAVSPQVKQVKGQAGGEAMWGISKATAAAYAAAHPAHVAPKAKKASKAKRQSKKAVRTQKLYEWVQLRAQHTPGTPTELRAQQTLLRLPHCRARRLCHTAALPRGVRPTPHLL